MQSIQAGLLELNLNRIFYYFITTVLVVRGSIFLALQHQKTPAVIIGGMHIHHFVFGFLLLLIAVYRPEDLPDWVSEIIIGIGTALIFDEFIYWSLGRFNYWSLGNFLALGFAGLTLNYLGLKNKPLNSDRAAAARSPRAVIQKASAVAFAVFIIFFSIASKPALAQKIVQETDNQLDLVGSRVWHR